MQSRVPLLRQLVSDSLYVIDERALAEAIVARAWVRATLPDSALRSARQESLIRSFRRDLSARSFRLTSVGPGHVRR